MWGLYIGIAFITGGLLLILKGLILAFKELRKL